jgi:DNA invertase Pin-like site-specific DNA recombinase
VEDLKTGAISGVIVAEQSCLVRPGKWADFGVLDHFKDNGVLIYIPSDRIDPNTRAGWYTLTVGGMISGNELNTLRERLDGEKQRIREKGKRPGGDHMLPRDVRYRARVRSRDR